VSAVPKGNSGKTTPNGFSERAAFRITLLYLIVGGGWTLFSNIVLRMLVSDVAALSLVQIYQGWIYVLATALMLHVLIHRNMQELHERDLEIQTRKDEINAILHTTPDIIFRISRDGIFMACHAPDESVLAVRPSEFLNRRLEDILPQAIARGAREHIHRALESGGVEVFEYDLFLQGERHWYEAHIAPYDEASVLAIVRDITLRRRAEAERARLATVIEQAAEGIILADTSGIIRYVNPAFETITGFTRQEALGRSTFFLRSEREGSSVYGEIRTALEKGEVWRGRLTSRRKDGAYFNAEIGIFPMRSATGEIVNYVGIVRDITREVELEKQFVQAQKMECVARLAGGIAHDFNNLLTTIINTGQILREEGDLPEDVRRDVTQMVRAAESGARLARRLLGLSRRTEVRREPVLLDEVLEGIEPVLRRAVGSQINFEASHGAGYARVMADRGELEQVIMNLVVNARDAMQDGGGRLIVRSSRVTLTAEECRSRLGIQPGEYVVLSVRDFGCGMSEEVREHAFDPFFTTKGKEKGTGLGLSTVYNIVQHMGGYIELDTELERGTKFRVYLPCLEGAPSDAAGAFNGESASNSLPL